MHVKSALFLKFFLLYVAISQAQLVPYGSQQFFELSNKITINDAKHSHEEETSYAFKSQLKVNSVWHSAQEQLLQVYFIEPRVQTTAKGSKGKQLVEQEVTQIPDRPFYISLLERGRVGKVIAHTSRDQSLLNLERGIASLFQLRRENGVVQEIDVSGQCSTFYEVKSTTKVEKTKTECSHWDLKVNYRAEKPLGVVQHSQEKQLYDLSAEGQLMRVESSELHSMFLTAKPDAGSQVESKFSLQHVTFGALDVEQLPYATLEEAIKSLLDWYRVFDIEADVDGALSELKGTTLKQQVSLNKKYLADEHIGKQTMATTLAELLPLARITKQKEFVEILNAHKELHAQLVDLLGAVQTIEAHNAIHEMFKYEENSHRDLLEKYLQSLAVATHPDRGILEDLLQRSLGIDDAKLRDSVIQTLASLTKQSGFEANDPLSKAVRSFLLDNLAKCEDVECETLYLRALRNVQDPSTIAILLEKALKAQDAKVTVAALEALKSFPIVLYNEDQRRIFAEIFYQVKRKYDSSARTLALDILLSMKPSKQQLGELLDYLASKDSQYEVKTFVVQKLRMLTEKCPRFAALLRDCLKEKPTINNYHILGQKGLTTVLTRRLSQEPAFNESLVSVQEIYKGVLKRGSVELILTAGREETSLFKLGIYTSGLTSFVGDSDESDAVEEDDADDSPATAGMEIAVQDVLLRPLVFFTGQSELMGHVWSGTASDPTPAFQATTLTQDHEHYLISGSGVTIYLRLIGMRSVDLNGKVSFSLWNRNAQTEIKQNSATAVLGYVAAGFTYAKLENHFQLNSEPNLSLQADLDFYSGIKLCMQLQRPAMTLMHSNTKSVALMANGKYSKKATTKYTHKSPGSTLALNQKNNDMCNMILDQ